MHGFRRSSIVGLQGKTMALRQTQLHLAGGGRAGAWMEAGRRTHTWEGELEQLISGAESVICDVTDTRKHKCQQQHRAHCMRNKLHGRRRMLTAVFNRIVCFCNGACNKTQERCHSSPSCTALYDSSLVLQPSWLISPSSAKRSRSTS